MINDNDLGWFTTLSTSSGKQAQQTRMSFTGGALKFKGGSPPGGVQKKKKKKKSKDEGKELAEADSSAPQATEEGVHLEPLPEDADRRTAAEKRFDERALKQEAERVKKMAAKSHRERVAQFNDYLANLSEHHDIPKVGPG